MTGNEQKKVYLQAGKEILTAQYVLKVNRIWVIDEQKKFFHDVNRKDWVPLVPISYIRIHLKECFIGFLMKTD